MSRVKAPGAGSKTPRPRQDREDVGLELREVMARLDAETRRCVARANEQATLLESIAGDAVEAIGDIHADDPAQELAYRAHRLRGVVLNALVVLAEFQLVAGRLDALASIQQAAEQVPTE
jgi:hypothetical protein